VPLFGRSREKNAAPAPPPELDADERAELDRLATLPLFELSEEVLRLGFSSKQPLPASSEEVKEAARTAVGLVDAYVSSRGDGLMRNRNVVLAHVREALHALLSARLLIRLYGRDPEWFILSQDGRAALDRGDVVEVLARRLPE
jgi:hypothetical protein